VALVRGSVTLGDFTEEAIKREDYLNISQKVTGHLDQSLSRHGVGPGRVTILMKNGESHTEEVEHCLGSVEKPMTFEDCAVKFKKCAAYSVKPLPANKIEQVIELIGRLEKLDDATPIIKMLG
jgi:2-methylcitrate dehydratase PrpD